MAKGFNIDASFQRMADAYDADVYGYFGDVQRPEDDWLYRDVRKSRRRRNVILILGTRGGDPHVAYRIARCLQQTYNSKPRDAVASKSAVEEQGKFIVLVTGKCKSAGTIMALGASEIWMSRGAEFGPIDVQLRKPDEVGERTSGLTPIQAMNVLERQSLSMFKTHFSQLRFDSELIFSTKMAAEIATSITVGLLSPISSQIDPIRLAEVDRSLRISADYGERLGKQNLKDGALERLLARYPTHGFVIDRVEAEEIFKNISDPPSNINDALKWIEILTSLHLDNENPFFFNLSFHLDNAKDDSDFPEDVGSGDDDEGEESNNTLLGHTNADADPNDDDDNTAPNEAD